MQNTPTRDTARHNTEALKYPRKKFLLTFASGLTLSAWGAGSQLGQQGKHEFDHTCHLSLKDIGLGQAEHQQGKMKVSMREETVDTQQLQ